MSLSRDGDGYVEQDDTYIEESLLELFLLHLGSSCIMAGIKSRLITSNGTFDLASLNSLVRTGQCRDEFVRRVAARVIAPIGTFEYLPIQLCLFSFLSEQCREQLSV